MAQHAGHEAGGIVGHERQGHDLETGMARQDRLGGRRHADGIGTQHAGGANFCRRLETRPAEEDVDAVVASHIGFASRRQQLLEKGRVVSVNHVDEAAVARADAEQRIDAGEIDVVADRHHRSRRHVEPQTARGIGLQQRLAAEIGDGADRAPHFIGLAALIVMRPPLQDGDRGRPDMSQDQTASMTADRGLRKPRQIGIGQDGDLLHVLDEATQA